MKLLIVTQAVDHDDPILGFFMRWIEEFAGHCESVEVICLREGLHTLPPNVRVHSLGKTSPRPTTFAARITYVFRFLSLIYKLRHQYDAVFVHMNPEYVVLGGLWWRSWHKPVVLWFVHKSVTLRLRIAAFFVKAICTAAPEGIRLHSKKIRVVGHGIDTARFEPRAQQSSDVIRIVTIGRIARSKGLLETLDAFSVLRSRGIAFSWTIVGAPVTAEERAYENEFKHAIAGRSYAASVQYLGAVPHAKLPVILAAADVLVNISSTGGYDKVVLEAVCSGVPAVSSSEPFRQLLGPYGLFIDHVDLPTIAGAILKARGVDVAALRRTVEEHHSLHRLIPAILQILS